jgi:cystinosin
MASMFDKEGIHNPDNFKLCSVLNKHFTLDNVSIPLSIILGCTHDQTQIITHSSFIQELLSVLSFPAVQAYHMITELFLASLGGRMSCKLQSESCIKHAHILHRAWTISFYPQVVLNYKRKSTIGLASDMLMYDLIGYIALSIYSVEMYYDEGVRNAYRNHHNGNNPAVQINDVFFAVHALFLTIFPLCQMAWYDGVKQIPSKLCFFNVGLTIVGIIGYLIAVLVMDTSDGYFTYFYWVYVLGFVKLTVTVLKYIPQIILNYQRQSTEGWNIIQIILDLMGGLFSALQLVLDANDTNEWNALTGNIQKVLLGFVTVIFDGIFIVQHYCLYHGMAPRSESAIIAGHYKPLMGRLSNDSA